MSQTAAPDISQTEIRVVPDPEISCQQHCSRCGKALAGLSVYKGDAIGKQDKRGSIVQIVRFYLFFQGGEQC